MASNRMLRENAHPTELGIQYDYEFNDELRESLDAYEQTEGGRAAKEQIEQFQGLLESLCSTKPRVLELASTMVAFFQAGNNWDAAHVKTAEFKAESESSPVLHEARQLAEEVVSLQNA
jgi:hypothetical protein